MKTLYLSRIRQLLFLLGILSLCFVACHKEKIVEGNEQTESVPENVMELIGELGFNPCFAINVEGGYLVEEDILVEDETINDLLHQKHLQEGEIGERSRANFPSLVLPDGNEIFNYYIDPGFGNGPYIEGLNWIAAITTAAQDWNAITNCDITPIRVYSMIPDGYNGVNILRDDNFDLPEGMKNLPHDVYGRACFANGTTTGRFISINTDKTNITKHIHRINVVRHELGHALGFAHSYGWPPSTDFCGTTMTSNIIPGTLGADPTSVLYQASALDVPNFSADDMKGARALYPLSCETPTIVSNHFQSNGGLGSWRIYLIANVPGGTYMQLEAKAIKIGTVNSFTDMHYQVGPTSNSEFYVDVDGSGTYDVTVTVRNYRGDCLRTSNAVTVVIP